MRKTEMVPITESDAAEPAFGATVYFLGWGMAFSLPPWCALTAGFQVVWANYVETLTNAAGPAPGESIWTQAFLSPSALFWSAVYSGVLLFVPICSVLILSALTWWLFGIWRRRSTLRKNKHYREVVGDGIELDPDAWSRMDENI